MREADYLAFTPEPPVRPWWRRRFFLGVGLVLLLAVAAFIGLFFYLANAAERELRQVIAELDKKEPNGWRLEEIEAQRAVIPDEQNSALCVLAAWKRLPEPSPPPPSQTSLQKRVWDLPRPILLDAQSTEELRRGLDRVLPALAEAQRLADQPAGRYPITWSQDIINTRFYSDIINAIDNTWFDSPEGAREIAHLLYTEGLLWANDGYTDRSLRSGRCALNAARSIGDEPFLMAQITRWWCQGAAVLSMERTLALGEPSAVELEAAQRLLEDEADQPLLWFAARGHRAGIHQVLEALTAGRTDLAQLTGTAAPSTAEKMRDDFMMLGIKRSHAMLLRRLTEFVEISKLPPEKQSGEIQKLDLVISEAAVNDLFTGLLMPGVSPRGISETFRQGQALLRCAAAGLAVERYRQVNKRWPGSLDELVQAKLLAAVPVDPWDGQPLRYQRTADGVVIYSVGRDGVDNRGDVSDDPHRDADLGFRLWDVAKRRQPPHEWIPPPRAVTTP